VAVWREVEGEIKLVELSEKNLFLRLFKNVRVQGAKTEQGRSVLPVREDLICLKQRSNRTFFNSLICRNA
jgi:hypothetical protein